MAATVTQTAVIAESGNLSGAMDLGVVNYDSGILAIDMPAAWTAANLTFQASADDNTYDNVYDSDGNELTVSAAADRYIVLTEGERSMLRGVRFLKVRSGTSGTPVAQDAERSILLVVR